MYLTIFNHNPTGYDGIVVCDSACFPKTIVNPFHPSPERTFRPKTGRRPFFKISDFHVYEFVHHETFSRGR
jgi:hypothetical protein